MTPRKYRNVPTVVDKRFKSRMASLFKSQQNRAEEKRDKNDRITRPGYELPFDREQFVAWFLGKLGGNEGSAIR
jgi:hypothetical protein